MMTDIKYKKTILFINALVPLVLLSWDGLHGRLGANPLEFITRTTGMLTLIFLLLSLAVTPIRRISGWNEIVKFRRMLGLYTFFYGFLHFIAYVWFDRFFNVKSMIADIAKRPFIAIGITAFFILIPLAITSTDRMIRRLGGKRWNRLHKLSYLAGMGGAIHYYMLVKSDTRLPLTFAFVLALLLGYRLFKISFTSRRSKMPPRSLTAID